MATIKILDPVTRLEGHLKIELTIDTVDGVEQVVDARSSGTMFRGFERLLVGRPPGDAPHITQRICGVCPVSHGLASVTALEALGGVTVPENARLLRNLVLGANFLASHILHFYHLSLLDFVAGPDRPPWTPRWESDLRITGAAASTLVDHYLVALGMRRKAHEMGALFGGRLPHPPTYVAGGFTTTPRPERISRFRELLTELGPFVEEVWIPDVEAVAAAYGDYFQIGAGPQALLAFGGFDLDAAGNGKLFPRGRIEPGSTTVDPLDLAAISESVAHAWYDDPGTPLHPASGETEPAYPKEGAYSWLKAARYDGRAYETGPLARMWVAGLYDHGISVLDRHHARALEARELVTAMGAWLDALVPTAPVCAAYEIPAAGEAFGLCEASRGALGHWLSLESGHLTRYQVMTPTCWNASPRDGSALAGPLEQALIGTPISNSAEPVEALRVVHSFDPCLACAVHVVRPKAGHAVERVVSRVVAAPWGPG